MRHVIYYIVFACWYVLSLLPLRALYVLSDLLYYPVYHWVGYRRRIVRKNLVASFPDKDESEIRRIEQGFYHFFCDYVVETLKLFSMSERQLRRRMTFSGAAEMAERMEREGKTFCFVYLGHYGNWEWIASLPYWVPTSVRCAQIYHPLYNKAFDALFLRLRSRFGGECIAMKETLRRIIRLRRDGQKTIIGFISDQTPKWNSIHHWTDFLHQDTPVFTGTEKIGKQVDALIYYADVQRPRRGYYHCTFKPLTDGADSLPDYGMTDLYFRQLEQMIRRAPALWLWSHNRWKRTREEWNRRQAEAATHQKPHAS